MPRVKQQQEPAKIVGYRPEYWRKHFKPEISKSQLQDMIDADIVPSVKPEGTGFRFILISPEDWVASAAAKKRPAS